MVPYEGPSTPQERTTNLREFPVSNSGTIVRVNLTTFAFAGSIDLTQIHPQLAGFSGAVRGNGICTTFLRLLHSAH